MALTLTYLDVVGYFVNDVDLIFEENHGESPLMWLLV